MEHYTIQNETVQNEKALYVIIWNDLQGKLLSEKRQGTEQGL